MLQHWGMKINGPIKILHIDQLRKVG